nr:MAG TPA: hypothetical protein [Caudoviricetes sp.]
MLLVAIHITSQIVGTAFVLLYSFSRLRVTMRNYMYFYYNVIYAKINRL